MHGDGVRFVTPYMQFVLGDLENNAFASFNLKPHMYCRYVDVEWPEILFSMEHLQNHFNSFYTSTKFTIEREQNNSLPFLDVKITHTNGVVTTKVYRKPIDTVLYLKYNSNLCKPVINGIVNSLLHRPMTQSSSKSIYKQEVEKVQGILIEKNYPKRLLDNIRKKREEKIVAPVASPEKTKSNNYRPIYSTSGREI
jgi:hypothetical protein